MPPGPRLLIDLKSKDFSRFCYPPGVPRLTSDWYYYSKHAFSCQLSASLGQSFGQPPSCACLTLGILRTRSRMLVMFFTFPMFTLLLFTILKISEVPWNFGGSPCWPGRPGTLDAETYGGVSSIQSQDSRRGGLANHPDAPWRRMCRTCSQKMFNFTFKLSGQPFGIILKSNAPTFQSASI